MTLQITQCDPKSKLQRYQEALTISEFKIKVHACDGAELSSALHIASGWVREMVRDRGCCLSASEYPVIFLPDTNKRIVTLLESILVYGSAEITLHERGDINSITEKLRMTALALGIELANLDVRPINKCFGDSNNNKVIEVVNIEDNEDEKYVNNEEVTSDGSSIDIDRSGSEVSLTDSSLLDGHNPNPMVSDEPVLNINENDEISRKTKVPVPVDFQDAASTIIPTERIADFDDEGIPHDLFAISQGRIPADTALHCTSPVSGEDTGSTEANSEVYTCGVCAKNFNREAKLKQHFRAFHGEDE